MPDVEFNEIQRWVYRLLTNPSLSPPQMTSLCKRLDGLWEENQGCVVLFTWIQFLKEEAFAFLDVKSPLEVVKGGNAPVEWKRSEAGVKRAGSLTGEKDKLEPLLELDPRAVLVVDPRTDILPQLLDFDEAQRQKVFDAKAFCCGICFMEKLGSGCLCVKECQHVYCKTCMTEYFQIQIRDGNVQCLNCPEPKCTSLATPSQVTLTLVTLMSSCDNLMSTD